MNKAGIKDSQGSSVGVQDASSECVEKPNRKESLEPNTLPIARGIASRFRGVQKGKPISGEQRIDNPEVGGSSPSPATNQQAKPFKRFDLRWAEPIGIASCPYITRWVLTINGYSIRLHHWHASDDQRNEHDHAWWYLSFVLAGFYIERSGGNTTFRNRFSLAFYPATHRHTVEVYKSIGCWTLLITGRPTRDWGFYVPGRQTLLRPLRYFSRHKHHPCE